MTGVIYVAIVALWGAVLIPMWLRRHDDDQARRIDRHRAAMGALAGLGEEEAQIRAAETKKRRVVISVILGVVALLSIVAFALGRTGVWEALIGILPLAVYEPSVFVASRMQAQTKARHARERSIAARQARQVNVVRPPEKSSTVHVFVPGSDSEWERALDRSA